MSDALAAVMARVSQIDARVREFDPAWTGLTWPGPAVAPGSFEQAITAAGSAAAAGPAGALGAGGAGSQGAVTDGVGGLRPATLTPAWAVSPAEAARSAAAAPAQGAGVIVAAPVASPANPGVASGKGIGGGIPFRLPIKGAQVSLAFGPTNVTLAPPATINGVRYAHFHGGIDYAAPEGTPVTAAASGTVVLAGRVADGAVNVVIRHSSGVETLYGHLRPDLLVRVGQKVKAGDPLGEVGMTGRTTGPHLHFALTRGGVPLDPAPLLARGILPGIGRAKAGSEGAGTAAGVGGPDFEAFDGVSGRIPYAKEIRAAAEAAGIDPLLLAGLVKFESGFRPDVVSSAGAMGLCQLMPFTAKALGITDPFDPVQNLNGGAKYLANNLRLYGRADLALAAYQAGKGSVDRAGGMPASTTTRNYVNGIIRTWSRWLREGSS